MSAIERYPKLPNVDALETHRPRRVRDAAEVNGRGIYVFDPNSTVPPDGVDAVLVLRGTCSGRWILFSRSNAIGDSVEERRT